MGYRRSGLETYLMRALTERRALGLAVRQVLDLQVGWVARQALSYARLTIDRYAQTGIAPPPLMAALVLTESCNLRCPMCDLPERYARSPHDQATRTWKLAIDQLAGMRSTAISFVGGEPAMRRDLCELVAHARSYKVPVNLTTNALLLTDERIERLIDADPSFVNVSVDSGAPDVNDVLRGGKNILGRTLDRITRMVERRTARGSRMQVKVVTVLSEANIDQLDDLFRVVSEAGADGIGFMVMHDIALGRCSPTYTRKRGRTVVREIERLSTHWRLPLDNSRAYLRGLAHVLDGHSQMPITCNAGYTALLLGPELSVYRCFPHFESARPIERWSPDGVSLAEMWNGPRQRSDRVEALSCRECYWNCHAELSHLVPM